MSGTGQQDRGGKPAADDPKNPDAVDDGLEDENKDDAKLWAEFDQAETGAPADLSPDDKSGKGDDEDSAAGSSESDDDEAGKGGDAPAAGSGEGDDPPPDQQQQRSPDDPLASAAPEVRAAYEAAQKKWEDRDKRLRGQISALTRQVNDLSTRAPSRDPSAAKPAAGAGDGKKGGSEDGEADGFIGSERWKSFEGEYPEVAGPLKELVGDLRGEITRQRKELDAIGSDRRQAALNEQENLLEQDHPNWRDEVAPTELNAWLDDQPRHIREAAQRNAVEIVDAAEAADVISRFKAFRSGQGGGTQTPNSDTPAPGNDAGQGNGKPRLSGKRQRQLESASGTRSRGPGVAHGIPEDGDEEAIWNAFEAKERREAQRA